MPKSTEPKPSPRKALPASTSSALDLQAPMPADQDSRHPLASEQARFALYLRQRSFAAVAKAAGVSPQAISTQADRHEWRERALAHDAKLGLSRAAVASSKALATLDHVAEAVAEEIEGWNEPDDDRDKLHRAAAVVAVVEKASKVQREAIADLPELPEPPLDLSPLSLAQLLLWMAQEEMVAALKALKPGASSIEPKPGALAAFSALVESDIGRDFLRAYGREHGLNGLPLGSSDLGIAPGAA